jgi:hypothetical protein
MAREQRERLGLVIGQHRRGHVALVGRQPRDPFGGGHRFPARSGRREQRIGLALDAQRQHARIRVGREALARRRQTHGQVAARQPDVGVGIAVSDRDAHLVGSARHRDVDRPVAGPGQLGRSGLESQRRDDERIAVGVGDLRVAPLGRRDLLARQRDLETLARRPHGQRLHIDGRRLVAEDQR